MKYTLARLYKVFHDKYPFMLETLNEGTSMDSMLGFEQKINVILPDSFKEFYQLHNGQKRTNLSLFDGDYLLPIDEIFFEWSSWNEVLPEIAANILRDYGDILVSEPDLGIKNNWWNVLWIPITTDHCGDSYCIDLDPAESGTYGQIIRMLHDNPARELVSKSFEEWIAKYVSDIEADKYYFSNAEGWGGMLLKDQ